MVISTIEGRSDGELRVGRQWICRVYQLDDDREVEIGHARLYTAPDLDEEALDDCDSISGDVETVMATISEDEELWGPVLIIDQVYVEEGFRGRGLASIVMQQAWTGSAGWSTERRRS